MKLYWYSIEGDIRTNYNFHHLVIVSVLKIHRQDNDIIDERVVLMLIPF